MTKVRKNPTISKPLIDEEAVLRFATAAAGPEPTVAADQIAVTIQLKKDLYATLEREAVRKGRTVEEQIRKVLAKHLL